MTDPVEPESDEFDSLRHSLPDQSSVEEAEKGPGVIARLGTTVSGLIGKIQTGIADFNEKRKADADAAAIAKAEAAAAAPVKVAKPVVKPPSTAREVKPVAKPLAPQANTIDIAARLGGMADDDDSAAPTVKSQTSVSDSFAEQATIPQFSEIEAEPTFIERLQTSITDLDPRLVVGVGVTGLGLVAIVGLLVLYSLARNRPSSALGTQVVIVTGNPTATLGAATLTQTLTPIPAMTETAGPSPTIDLTGTVTNLPLLRFATLSDIKGSVQVRSDANAPWKTVNETLTIVPGTTVLTGENSTVKITMSQGAIVRLSSQTQFTLIEMSGTASRPETVLGLDFGKLWAIVEKLGEGTFEIQMPSGVAAVRGTYVSAEHNTTDKIEIVTCLEGSCSYRNTNGRVTLKELQQTESIDGAIPAAPHPMDASQLADWNPKDIPEILALTPTLVPTLTHVPTETKLPSATPGPSKTPSTTLTPSKTLTATSTASKTSTGTITATFTFTVTKSATATFTSTYTKTPTKTPTPSLTPSQTLTPSNTPVTPTDTPVTPTDTPVTPTDTPVTPTDTPVTPTDTLVPSDTPVTPTDTPVPSDTPGP